MHGVNEKEQGFGESEVLEHADRYYNKYNESFDLIESKSVISQVIKPDPYYLCVVGQQLEMQEKYQKYVEAKGSASDLGKIPDIALDVISLFYGTSPISLIAGVQPIPDEIGTVHYRETFANTTKGNVTAGDKLNSPLGSPGVIPTAFAGDQVTESIGPTVATTLAYAGTLTNLPLRKHKVSVSVVVGANTFNGQDDGGGLINGYGLEGTVNYVSGAVTITLSTDPAGNAGQNINFTYSQDYEAANDIPEIVDRLVPRAVQARTFVLKNTFGILQNFIMSNRFGSTMDDNATQSLVGGINMEIVGTAINLLLANATGNVTWDKTPPTGISYFEHKQSFKDFVSDSETVLLGNAGRGTISVHVAGRKVSGVIKTLPGFKKISESINFGPHLFGTLDGVPVIRVPNSGMLNEMVMLNVYKGSNFDAPVVYSPFMPLVSTSAMPNGVNPLSQQKAAAVMAGVDILNPNLVTKFTMIQS